jgi:Tfp pilus assembly protein PilE
METTHKTSHFIIHVITIAVIILAVVLAIAVYQRGVDTDTRMHDAAARQAAAKQAEQHYAVLMATDRVRNLETSVHMLQTDKASLCQYVSQLQAAKPIRGLVTVPAGARCTQ